MFREAVGMSGVEKVMFRVEVGMFKVAFGMTIVAKVMFRVLFVMNGVEVSMKGTEVGTSNQRVMSFGEAIVRINLISKPKICFVIFFERWREFRDPRA